MYIGHENKWGFSFKSDSDISSHQQTVLGANLARLDGNKCFFTNSLFQFDEQKHYLPKNIKSIIGIEE